jgi:hypothetical protein
MDTFNVHVNRLILLLFLFTLETSMAQDTTTCTSLGARKTDVDDLDVALDDGDCTTNYQSWHEMVCLAWTAGGQTIIDRSLIKFDASAIPSNATINSAILKLHKHPNPTSANGIAFNGDCSFWVQQINSSWSPSSVKWCNQPSVNLNNQIGISCSSFINSDSIMIDVTSMFASMLVPSNNNGFMIRMMDESPYNSATFASQNFSNSSKWPSLDVCYTVPLGIHDRANRSNQFLQIYDEESQIRIASVNQQFFEYKLFDMSAAMVYQSNGLGREFSISKISLSKGLYILEATKRADNATSYYLKFVIQ